MGLVLPRKFGDMRELETAADSYRGHKKGEDVKNCVYLSKA